MSVLQDVEKAVLSVIHEQYSDVVFDLWFKDLHLVELNEKEAVFAIASTFKQNIIQSRHADALKAALMDVNGFASEVRIVYREEEQKEQPPQADSSVTEQPKAPDPEAGEMARAIENRSIVSEYTFENYIVGDSNKFAHAACYAVAKSPTTYNPLFIHGPSGLGKTHLLYAVTNEMKRNNPNIRLIYKKCEEFTNEMIESLQKGTTIAFKEKYRTADVLLIDDIQFIAGKVAVQEEFFHTFNTLYEAEKQIILTSDRPPRDIRPLEERLMTRFEWGLIADIQPPSLELRCAIIQKKAEQRGITLAPEIVNFLAENLRVNIRQIEGSIKKIAAISMLTGTPVSLDMTKRAISDILSGTEPAPVTVERIFDAVSKKYGIPVEEIKGDKRNKSIAQARHVAVYIIRHVTSLPVTSIGEILNRDHATVLASVNKIKNDMRLDRDLADTVESIISQIKQ